MNRKMTEEEKIEDELFNQYGVPESKSANEIYKEVQQAINTIKKNLKGFSPDGIKKIEKLCNLVIKHEHEHIDNPKVITNLKEIIKFAANALKADKLNENIFSKENKWIVFTQYKAIKQFYKALSAISPNDFYTTLFLVYEDSIEKSANLTDPVRKVNFDYDSSKDVKIKLKVLFEGIINLPKNKFPTVNRLYKKLATTLIDMKDITLEQEMVKNLISVIRYLDPAKLKDIAVNIAANNPKLLKKIFAESNKKTWEAEREFANQNLQSELSQFFRILEEKYNEPPIEVISDLPIKIKLEDNNVINESNEVKTEAIHPKTIEAWQEKYKEFFETDYGPKFEKIMEGLEAFPASKEIQIELINFLSAHITKLRDYLHSSIIKSFQYLSANQLTELKEKILIEDNSLYLGKLLDENKKSWENINRFAEKNGREDLTDFISNLKEGVTGLIENLTNKEWERKEKLQAQQTQKNPFLSLLTVFKNKDTSTVSKKGNVNFDENNKKNKGPGGDL